MRTVLLDGSEGSVHLHSILHQVKRQRDWQWQRGGLFDMICISLPSTSGRDRFLIATRSSSISINKQMKSRLNVIFPFENIPIFPIMYTFHVDRSRWWARGCKSHRLRLSVTAVNNIVTDFVIKLFAHLLYVPMTK